jgi:peptidoglycan hydrolase-like protein with peptidoglycan-binding domain
MLAGIVDRIFEDPARSGGLMVVAMTATAIACNALFLQHAQRPAPLFPNRTAVAPAPVPMPNPAPAFRAGDAVGSGTAPDIAPASVARTAAPAIVAPPLPRLSPARSILPKQLPVQAAPQAQVQPATQTTVAQPSIALVTDIQRALARLGIYTGPIDGRTGQRTSAAIAKYEEAVGLAVTGQPTPEFLHVLQHPLSATAAEKAADPIAAKLDRTAAQQPASTTMPQQDAAAVKAAAARKATADAAASAAAATKMAATYRTVQTALNRIGYGPVPVDGAANKATLDAIRGFELDNGLSVSGEPSDALIQRLVAIGAIKLN